jgi:hypothetical protein
MKGCDNAFPFCHSDDSRSEEEESAFLDSATKLSANSRFLRVAPRIVGMTKVSWSLDAPLSPDSPVGDTMVP